MGKLKAERSNINYIWNLVDSYVVPFRSDIYNEGQTENSVDWRVSRNIYDSTAADACETLSSVIHGSITSMAVKFFSLRFRQDELNENEEAIAWLQECEDLMFEAMQDSNFDVEASEFYLDLTSYGTSVIVQEAESEVEWDGMSFTAVPVSECYFDQDHKGNIVNFYRDLEWTATQIIEKFGRENVPSSVLDKENNTETKINVIFCIFKRKGKMNAFTETAPMERQFGFKYVLEADGEIIGEEGGYYEMAAFVARWRKTSRSKWGFSPAFICLPDVLTLNQIVEDTLEALGKVIDPATLTTQRGLISDLDLGRAGLTVVKNIDDIKAYESKARFDVGEIKIDRLQGNINRAYHIDKLRMKENVEMTAEEFRGRYEMLNRMLGPTAGRLQNDFLKPCVERTFNLLYRAKRLPEMPNIVRDAGGVLDIEFIGPMARDQKRVVVQSTMEWLGNLGSMAETFPDVLDIPNIDKISRETGTMSGVPIKYMNAIDDVKKAREARNEAATRNAQNQAAELEGKAKEAQGKGEMALEESGNGQQ